MGEAEPIQIAPPVNIFEGMDHPNEVNPEQLGRLTASESFARLHFNQFEAVVWRVICFFQWFRRMV